MGSPFSLALCLMFVLISEQIWFKFATTLSSMQLLACMLRYVDSRMVLLPSQYISHPTFEVLLDQDFYGQPFFIAGGTRPGVLGFSGGIRPIWNTQPCPLGALLPHPFWWADIPHVVISSPKDPIHLYRPIKDWILVWATNCSNMCCSVCVDIYVWSCICISMASPWPMSAFSLSSQPSHSPFEIILTVWS